MSEVQNQNKVSQITVKREISVQYFPGITEEEKKSELKKKPTVYRTEIP